MNRHRGGSILVQTALTSGAICTRYGAPHTMKRFTVSLPDDLYEALHGRCRDAVPPSSLQQMVRFAVESVVLAAAEESPDAAAPGNARETPSGRPMVPVDLLAFTINETIFGLPIAGVETVATTSRISPVPSASATFVGVARFRGELVAVHDGGLLFGDAALQNAETAKLLAVSTGDRRVLISVTAVVGLAAGADLTWDPPPEAAAPWIAALAWDEDRVVTVIDATATVALAAK
jgi:chemotaxis signal transduction protein